MSCKPMSRTIPMMVSVVISAVLLADHQVEGMKGRDNSPPKDQHAAGTSRKRAKMTDPPPQTTTLIAVESGEFAKMVQRVTGHPIEEQRQQQQQQLIGLRSPHLNQIAAAHLYQAINLPSSSGILRPKPMRLVPAPQPGHQGLRIFDQPNSMQQVAAQYGTAIHTLQHEIHQQHNTAAGPSALPLISSTAAQPAEVQHIILSSSSSESNSSRNTAWSLTFEPADHIAVFTNSRFGFTSKIKIHNNGEIAQKFEVQVQGTDATKFDIQPTRGDLAPGQQETIMLTLLDDSVSLSEVTFIVKTSEVGEDNDDAREVIEWIFEVSRAEKDKRQSGKSIKIIWK